MFAGCLENRAVRPTCHFHPGVSFLKMVYYIITCHYALSEAALWQCARIGLVSLAFTAHMQHQTPTGSVAPEMRLPPLIPCEPEDSSLLVCCYGNTVGRWQRGEKRNDSWEIFYLMERAYENERQRGVGGR